MSELGEARADPGILEEGLVLVAVESSITRSVLWGGLRHSGFRTAVVSSAQEARAVLEAHGRGGVLLLDAGWLVEQAASWAGLAESAPPVALVAVSAASGAAFAKARVEELGCICLEEPLDLERVLDAVRAACARRGGGRALGDAAAGGAPEGPNRG